MEIFLARAQGFCAGVAFAVATVERAIEKYGTPLFVYHDIVHNTAIVESFQKRGIRFVDDLNEVPQGAQVIFSAHGVPPSIYELAKERKLKSIDATCPLVRKVHQEAIRFSSKNVKVILIGHKGHQEIIGTAGYINPSLLHIVQTQEDIDGLDIRQDESVAYLTQTTLSVDETREMIDKLRNKFCKIVGPLKEDICYATQLRQDAIKELAGLVELIIVCGSANSSNSNRLCETGRKQGVKSIIVDNENDLDLQCLENKNKIGISSGASVPEYVVERVIAKIQNNFPVIRVHSFESLETDIHFPLPKI